MKIRDFSVSVIFVFFIGSFLAAKVESVHLECDISRMGAGMCSVPYDTNVAEFGVDDWHRYSWEFPDLRDSDCSGKLGNAQIAEWLCSGPKEDVFLLSGPAAYIPANTSFKVTLEIAANVQTRGMLFLALVDRNNHDETYSRLQINPSTELTGSDFKTVSLPASKTNAPINGLDLVAWFQYQDQNGKDPNGFLKFRNAKLEIWPN